MKVEVSEQSIKHLVDSDCVDMVVQYIRKLEADNANLRTEVEVIRKDRDLMFQSINENREAYLRLYNLYMKTKGIHP